jgi:hypothetical protein
MRIYCEIDVYKVTTFDGCRIRTVLAMVSIPLRTASIPLRTSSFPLRGFGEGVLCT